MGLVDFYWGMETGSIVGLRGPPGTATGAQIKDAHVFRKERQVLCLRLRWAQGWS